MEKIKNMLHMGGHSDEKSEVAHGSTQASHSANSGTFNTTPASSATTTGHNTVPHSSHANTNTIASDKPSSTTGVYAGNQGVDHGRTTDSTAIGGTGREGLDVSSTGIPHRPAESASSNYGTSGMPVTGQHTTYAANMLDPRQHSSSLTNESESALTHHKSGPDPATGGGAEAADGDHPGGVKGRTIDVAAREAGVGGPHSNKTHLGEEGARTGVGSRQQLADRGASYTGQYNVSNSGHDHSHSHSHGTTGVPGAEASLLAAEQHRHDSSTLGSKVQPMGNTLHERNHYGNETSQTAILHSHPTHREGAHEHDAGALGSAPLHSSSVANAVDPRVDVQQHNHRGTGYDESGHIGRDAGLATGGAGLGAVGAYEANTHHHGHSHSGSQSGIDLKTGRGLSSTQDAALGAGNVSGIAGPTEPGRSLAAHSEHHIGGHAPSGHEQRRAAALESSTHSHGSSGLGHSSHNTSTNVGDYGSNSNTTVGSTGLGHHNTSSNTAQYAAPNASAGSAGPYGAAGVGSTLPSSTNNPLNFAGNANDNVGHTTRSTPVYDQMSNDNVGHNDNVAHTTRSTPIYDQMIGSSATHNTSGERSGGSESYSNLDPSVPRSGTSGGLLGEGVNTRSEGIAGTTAGTGARDASGMANQKFGTITDHTR